MKYIVISWLGDFVEANNRDEGFQKLADRHKSSYGKNLTKATLLQRGDDGYSRVVERLEKGQWHPA